MPSENYHYNQGDEWMGTEGNKNPNRFLKKRHSINRIAPKIYNEARTGYSNLSPVHQKEVQRKLSNLQKGAPSLAKNIASKKPSALAGLAGNMLRKIDWSKDWMFIPFLASVALLKDIFDIAFAVTGTWLSFIPIFGQATVAVGMVITFVGEVVLLILTIMVLVLTGSSLKNRGLSKYFVGLAVAFISEALPGIGWLPLAFIEILILYGFVLFDRAFQEPIEQVKQGQAPDVPTYAAADNYYSDEQMAA